MPAARYWRVVGISTYGGGDLELSDIALYSGGTRVDGSATFASTFAPISAGRWAAADVRQPGFALQWDFGVAQDVDDVQFTPTTARGGPGFWVVQHSESGAFWATAFSGWARWDGSPPVNVSGGDPDYKRFRFIWNAPYNLSLDNLAYTPAILTSASFVQLSSPNSGLQTTVVGTTGRQIYYEVSDVLQGDFTIETYLGGGITTNATDPTPANVSAQLSLNAGSSLRVKWVTNSDHRIEVTDASGIVVASESSGVAANTTRHVAWTREGSTNTLWVAGQNKGTWIDDIPVVIDRVRFRSAERSPAYFGPTRIEAGVCRYTAAFAPPVAANFMDGSVAPLKPQAGLRSVSSPTRISEYTPPATVASKPAPAPNRIDIAYGGTATVAGTVKKVPNVPLRRRVRLYDENGRQFIREVWSDAVTGEFVFSDLNPAYAYTVITYDYENNYRALTVDKVVAV